VKCNKFGENFIAALTFFEIDDSAEATRAINAMHLTGSYLPWKSGREVHTTLTTKQSPLPDK